jgi:hypothetical protein
VIVIEGLKVTVDGVELVELCDKRAAHHRERAAVYNNQVQVMQENKIEAMHNTSAGDPTAQLRDKAKTHEAEAEEMTFIADHIEKDKCYLLGREDLVKLGITKSRY